MLQSVENGGVELSPAVPISVGRPRGLQRGSLLLRRALVGFDAAALAASWLAFLVGSGLDTAGVAFTVGAASLAGLAVIATQHLYRARACSVRAVEAARLARGAVASAVAATVAAHRFDASVSLVRATLGAVTAFLLLVAFRSAYRSALSSARKRGRLSRSVVVIGANEEGIELSRMLGDHPELGFRVCGLLGEWQDGWQAAYDGPWLGGISDTAQAVRRTGASGAFVASSALSRQELNRVARELLALGVHVQVSAGLRGIAQRRLRPTPLNREQFFYLETVTLAGWQGALKRALDLVISSLAIIALLPVTVVVALLIKMQDGGPVFFRQQRVGRDGVPFRIWKFRTMVPDAEERLDLLRGRNERNGPLFKLAQDPRVTRIGRLLRATSIDELPQLINVVRGNMSLVGPRPALPDEVALFDEDFLGGRQCVRPGITGLWQVEARDCPSFALYQELDLFYVENWSVILDVAILLSTVKSVAWRGLRALARHPVPERADLIALD